MILAYALSPIDLVPDFIPVIGYLDDLLIVPIGLYLAIKLIPEPLMQNFRSKARARLAEKKPVSWVGAIAIIAIWMVVLSLVAYCVYRLIR